MRVPTTDYSPLRQANAQNLQAKRSQFIAPDIDYKTQSLQLRAKGLDQTMSQVKTQETLGTLRFINRTMSRLIGAGLQMTEAAQEQEAQTFGNQLADQLNTKKNQMVASGEMYVDYNADIDTDPTHNTAGKTGVKIVGLDKLQEFENQQLDAIREKGWFKNIENRAISAMEGIYAGTEQRMLQDYYNKEAQDKFKLEQLNLQSAIDQDIANSTFETPSFSNSSAVLDSFKGYSPSAMSILKMSTERQINLGVAANAVRNKATEPGADMANVVSYAQEISKSKGFSQEEEQNLISIANQSSRQSLVATKATGVKLADDAIRVAEENGTLPNFSAVYEQADEMKKGMSYEKSEALMEGIEQRQLGHLMPIYADITKDADPDLMTDTEREEKVNEIKALKEQFDGTAATQALYDRLIKKYSAGKETEKETEKEMTEREYTALKKARIEFVKGALDSNEMTPSEIYKFLRDTTAEVNTKKKEGTLSEKNSLDLATDLLDLSAHVESSINKKYGSYFDDLRETIASNLKTLKENDKNWGSGETKTSLGDIQEWAAKSLFFKLCESNDWTPEKVQKEVDKLAETYNVAMVNDLVNMKKGLYENDAQFAMRVTEQFETRGSSLIYNDQKKLGKVISPMFDQQYEPALKALEGMLSTNYGVDVKENKRDVMYLGDRLVPVFEDKKGNSYFVMGQKAYRVDDDTNSGRLNVFELPLKKDFVREGYESRPAMLRYVNAPTGDYTALSTTTRESGLLELMGRNGGNK